MDMGSDVLRRRIGLVGAVLALVMLYFASGSPVPLYSMYKLDLGLTQAQLSMTSMWYLLGTVIPLLFLSRLSDHLGRRPVTAMTLCFSITGCCIFAYLSSPEMLMVGRFVQGIASGLGSSTVAAYIVDLCVGVPKWIGPAITSSAPALGLSTGAFTSGGICRFTDISGPSVFLTIGMVLLFIIAMVLVGAETMGRHPGAIGSIRPRVTLPQDLRRMFLVSAAVFVGTWAVGGFYQGFSSSIVAEMTGFPDTFTAAAVFTASLLPNAIGGFLANRFDVRTAQRGGMLGYTVCTVSALFMLGYGSLTLFTVLIMLAALLQGIAFTGSVTGLISRTGKTDRAGMFSTIYLTSYGGSAIPNLVVGMTAGNMASADIMMWYCVLVVVLTIIVFLFTIGGYDPSDPSSEGLIEDAP